MKHFQKLSLVFLGILGLASVQAVGVGQNPPQIARDQAPFSQAPYSQKAASHGSADQTLAGAPDWAGQSAEMVQGLQSAQSAGSAGASSGVSGPNVGAAGDIIGFSHSDGTGSQRITLVNTSKSWMAVYHIDRSGKIRLASSRPIDADFTLQLNATAPLPDEIRRMDRR